ncbi:MAG: DUF1566 domain-containing protein [Treponema sp.]|nr:DUF1566 domain-containing protein [Treponema sp.]
MTDVVADVANTYLSPLGGKGRSGEKVLVLHFRAPTVALNDWAIDRFTEVFKQKGLVPVERQNRPASLAAAGEKINVDLDDASSAVLGAQVSVNTVFTGSFTPQGNNWALVVRAVSVSGQKTVWSKKYLIQPGATFVELAKPAPAQATAPKPAPAPAPAQAAAPKPAPAPAPAQAAAPKPAPASAPAQAAAPKPASAPAQTAAKTYKVGDIGPAGGLVFYDKGDNSDGWRYLEAAPADTEVSSAKFAAENVEYGSNQRALGTGKFNSKSIMDFFVTHGGGFDMAVRICDDLVVNGYDDWFLPSQDELNYMYGNLHRKNLGHFQAAEYWSSSAEGNSKSYFIIENFANGRQTDSHSSYTRRVRAARQF